MPTTPNKLRSEKEAEVLTRKRSTAGPIRDADDLIDEATKRLAAMERALEALQRRRRRWSTLAPSAQKELREQIDYFAGAARDRGAGAGRTDRASRAAGRVHGLGLEGRSERFAADCRKLPQTGDGDPWHATYLSPSQRMDR